MKYGKVVKATFISRPNRFIAVVDINGEVHTVHVKNTGRCRELLISGATVYLERPEGGARKTEYDLIAVEKEREGRSPLLINMDSQAPNAAIAEWLPRSGLFGEGAKIRREYTVGASRFDFMIEDGEEISYAEVKGVTLENNGIAMFPDAPTERGVKHLRELTELSQLGHKVYVIFLIQMKGAVLFRPNEETHKEFADALREAKARGVNVIALDSHVTHDSLIADSPLPIEL